MVPESTSLNENWPASPTQKNGEDFIKLCSTNNILVVTWETSLELWVLHEFFFSKKTECLQNLRNPCPLSLVDTEFFTLPEPRNPHFPRSETNTWKTTVIHPELFFPHFLLFSIQDVFQMWSRSQNFSRPRKEVWWWALPPKIPNLSNIHSYFTNT